MDTLQGRVVVVTGGGSGIGRALCHTFAGRGCRVVVGDIEHTRAASVAGELATADALAVAVDVADPRSVERLHDRVVENCGSVDIVCNNAGIAHVAPILATSAEEWRRVIDVNLLGVVHGVLAFAPALLAQGHGHVINTASMAGFVAGSNLASYDASKHAVVAFTENLWRELRGTGVGVSLLAPAFVDTALFAHASGDESTRRSLSATTARHGISPQAVAEATADAVVEDRFWIFTHDETVPMVTIKGAYALAGLPPADPFRAPPP